ncbi:MAG: hypothetical protein F7B18_05465 [Desulfurococcales archaeon]|nr:hypothetical protein [Desulfurococcales archaeon]
MQRKIKRIAPIILLAIILFSGAYKYYTTQAVMKVDNFGDVLVTYRGLGLGGKPTIKIEVLGTGKKAKVSIDAFYPRKDGVEELRLSKAKDWVYTVESITIAKELASLVDGAGWRLPTGIGILAFIKTIEDNETHIKVGTMPVSIPLRPDLAQESVVEVKVRYKPTVVDVIDKKELEARIGQAQAKGLLEEPPGEVEDECIQYPDTPPYEICYMWIYNATLYESPGYEDPLPMSITIIDDSRDAEHIANIDHITHISIDKRKSDTLTFLISLGMQRNGAGLYISVPGAGFTINPASIREVLLDLTCTFDNSYNDASLGYSGCHNFGQAIGGGAPFYYDGIVATGVKAKIWIVKYDYVEAWCPLGGCIPLWKLGEAVTTWVVPKSLDGVKLHPWIMVDDTFLYDDYTVLDAIYEGVLSGVYTGSNTMSIYDQRISTSSHVLFQHFDTTPELGISIPVGLAVLALAQPLPPPLALIVASLTISLSYEMTTYYSYDTVMHQLITYDSSYSANVYMYKVAFKYYVGKLDRYYDAAIFIVNPE